jgi:hypothetical protein
MNDDRCEGVRRGVIVVAKGPSGAVGRWRWPALVPAAVWTVLVPRELPVDLDVIDFGVSDVVGVPRQLAASSANWLLGMGLANR